MNDINDPVWSVIILLCCGLAFTAYCVFYILRLSYQELNDETPESDSVTHKSGH